MRAHQIFLAMLAGISMAHAADIEAGKARVNTVCAACHGANGVSVATSIPNLAGQKADYITGQLQAFRAGDRKDDLMNPIAGQLGDEDIENVAAFFASLQGAPSGAARSDLLPSVARSRVSIPADYRATFTKYLTMDFPDDKLVRHLYASPAAVEAARAGAPLPDGSMILMEVYRAKLDAQEIPVKGGDGFFVPDELVGYGAMEKQAGWGAEFPDILRNGDWNYAPFTPDKTQREGFNQAVCLACHKPKAEDSHLFTLAQLREFAMKK
jgi:cytochrome c553